MKFSALCSYVHIKVQQTYVIPVCLELLDGCSCICGGSQVEELDEAFRGFVLTKDNMVKLVDVAERLRAKLSCILLGEAGCGKTVPQLPKG